MPRRMRHFAVRSLLLLTAVTAMGGAMTEAASADVTTDMNDWFVDTSYDPYASQFTISSGGPHAVQFRWLDSPNKETNIYATSCGDNTAVSSVHLYPVGNTSYQTLFNGNTGYCFRIWGATGSGSMSDHDGRVSR
jgi:hypothetical protein